MKTKSSVLPLSLKNRRQITLLSENRKVEYGNIVWNEMQIQRKLALGIFKAHWKRKSAKKEKKKFPITVKLSNYPRKIQP